MSAVIDIAASHQSRLGCSKIAQALELSRWGTSFQLWEQYTGRAPWPNIGGLRVALGEPMEEVLRPFVEARLERDLRRDRREYVHPTLPLVGHVDYRASLIPGEKTRPVVDMKTSLGFRARQRFGEGEDAVDPDVLLQMQGYMLLTGAETAYVAALVPGPDLLIYTLRADREIHDLIRDGIADFWRCVITDTPPKITTLEDASRRWPFSEGSGIEVDSAYIGIANELRDLYAQIKVLKSLANEKELALKFAMGDHEALLSEGRPICTWKNQTATRFDWVHFREEMPELHQQYQKTTQSRVFRLPKEKK